jgi:hypothetical protein
MNTKNERELITIGRTLAICFEDEKSLKNVLAKVDTGAYLGAIWATDIHENGGVLYFTLFGAKSVYYTGEEHSTTDYKTTTVENSFGQSENRYVVRLPIKPYLYAGSYEDMRFSLCDRSMKRYPILLGRDYIRGRFLVDVRLNDEHLVRDDEEKTNTRIDEE